MIQIYTNLNPLGKKEGVNKYCFRSIVDQTLSHEQLIREIVSYNSTITEADVRAVLSILDDRVRHFVNLGYKVELPFGYAFLRANGTVSRLNDGFALGTLNHRISAAFTFKDEAAQEMQKDAAYRLAGTGYVKLPVVKCLCSILKNGQESDSLEFLPGAMLRVRGKHISFDAADEAQGVFLIGAENKEIRLERYNHIGTNVIEAYIGLTTETGSYEVKIVTKPGIDRYEKAVFSARIAVTAGLY